MTRVDSGFGRALRRAGGPIVRQVRRLRHRYELRDALTTIRAARGGRLVLLYHRVAPRDACCNDIVPTIELDRLREHLTVLGDLGRFTPLNDLLSEPDGAPPLRFALTFDDDFVSHVRYVLPVLREFGIHGTFFLSGRGIHGLGAHWFERLEALVSESGLRETAALLDLPEAIECTELVQACEANLERRLLIDRYAPPAEAPIGYGGIQELVDAGMTLGFHTLHHPVLPSLGDDALSTALIEGRTRLAGLVGGTLDWLAYPHGKADARTARLVRQAGYRAAWTTQPHLLHGEDDPLLRGRLAPRPVSKDDLIIRLGRLLEQERGLDVSHAS